ncbi:hypothetical protein G9Q84_25400 [Pseudomonas sp. P7]|uniref:contact-dependent growth inhibition system immunity protein n=1 Tax=Pseudomonas TaxID=286 RepID=UPI000BCC8162|nr:MULTISPECIES: contact-dependent growth inhibition system immunity protein [Pseudomonas]MBA2926213.1 hypothetical protein [Pseudomonas sivasensis]OYT78498.1 MAG: hypothetical protein CFE48_15135 [Pseudomonas sp. PGPPP2]
MNNQLTELQQFFGGYFNQDWPEDHASADEVIDTFLLESSKDLIFTVRNEILDLIASYTNESEFQENLLHEQYCFYYYPYQWATGPLWLEHVIRKFDNYLLEK